ncbi:MAG TPA: 1-phosphofructokinase, partial [Feifaniaceae bacterium]|nr:1-phosphofructokinase [Feifaniaceae bacterium]
DKTGVVETFTPGAVNRMKSVRTDPGGKGINVSKTLRMLGEESRAIGILGGNTGAWIESALKESGIDTDFVMTEHPTRTNLKLIDCVSGDTTDINEPGAQVTEHTLSEVKERLLAGLIKDDIVVFSGSLPPGAPETLYGDWAGLCREHGAKAFVDADGGSLRHAVGAVPYAVKPNRHELSRLFGRELQDIGDILASGMRLIDGGVKIAAVSLGGDGALFLSKNARYRGCGLQVEAKSTVGAGDSMMAALAFGEARGMELEKTARLAIAVSAASVMQSGSQSADPNTVRELLGRVRLEKL